MSTDFLGAKRAIVQFHLVQQTGKVGIMVLRKGAQANRGVVGIHGTGSIH